MALDGFLRIIGSAQGAIPGSVTKPGREDTIAVIGFANELVTPLDPSGGRTHRGRRQMGPMTITKEIDRASIGLHHAHTTGEPMQQWRLEVWRPTQAGVEEHFYTIELGKVLITGFGTEMLNNRYPENLQHPVREHVTFSYQSITWTHLPSNLQTTDGV